MKVSASLEAFGRTEYLHFIVRSHHLKYIDYIKKISRILTQNKYSDALVKWDVYLVLDANQ